MPRRRNDPRQGSALEKGYWRASDAQEVLDLWHRSGENLSVFARTHGLCRNRLARWRDRLAEEGVTAGFHRVRVVGPLGSLSTADDNSAGVEIVVLGGRRVAVRSGFDAALLVEVVRVLESIQC